MKIASSWASCISSPVTLYWPRSRRRASFSSSLPIDTHVSVTITSAPAAASIGSVNSVTDPPVSVARRSASAITSARGA